MEKIEQPEILFAITMEDLQSAAKEKIGRELTNDEIEIAKKGLAYGFMTDINTIYNTIFNEMI
ncbi:MAG: hypothetical protein NW226_22555 [Microscillaceae bacterium]|nr:hypothetical protein [Microscillaceae bacterium]